MDISELRRSAASIWMAALDAARPDLCVSRALRLTASGFAINGSEVPVRGRLIVVGAGKAGAAMARAVEVILGSRISAGVVVTKYGHAVPTTTIRIHEAGHPVPDESGLEGVRRIRECLRDLSSDDVVLCLISGGGSALLPLPAHGLTLEEKGEVTARLLAAGATIRDLNAVRKHLSAVKGGQLARWSAPARLVSLIMSDVIGDPVDFIASGPTAPDTSTFADAFDVLVRYGVDIPAGVERRLRAGLEGTIAETPKAGDPIFRTVTNHLIANNRLMLTASAERARELGFCTMVLSSEVEGEARDIGRLFAAIGREMSMWGEPVRPPACVLAAGETTVHVRGEGLGGRNLEMALAWAHAMEYRDDVACFASVASDGTDGPTNAAGGLVDPTTCRRAALLGLNSGRALEANDSLTLLDAVGDVVRTGPTHTNLMDLQVLLVAAAADDRSRSAPWCPVA